MEFTIINELKNIVQRMDALETQIKDMGSQQHNSKEWMDNADLKAYLNVGDRTLQNYRDNDIIPYSKLGGKIFYRREDIERVLLENMQGQ
ncbi:helix-turn-helix domain-containing protein [Carboxylicivirga mesophila]|nr:helix-turn-helix domain-containing protein [Carboxylicivirga mesophila]